MSDPVNDPESINLVADPPDPETLERPWERLEELADAGSVEPLAAFLESLSPSDQALALSRTDEAYHKTVLTTLPAEDAAELLRHLSETQAAELIESLPAEDAAVIVQEMPSDEQA